jgi:hypothetical protein
MRSPVRTPLTVAAAVALAAAALLRSTGSEPPGAVPGTPASPALRHARAEHGGAGPRAVVSATPTIPAPPPGAGRVGVAPCTTVRGHVRDRAGGPIAGALLRRLDPHGVDPVRRDGTRGELVATTGADGAFAIDDLGDGPWALLVTSADHPDHLERSTTRGARTGLELVLDDGMALHGRIAAAPAWVGELVVHALGEHGGVARRARCATDGSFVLRGLAPGAAHRVAAFDADADGIGPPRTAWADVPAGATRVELVHHPEAALVFRVVDGATGVPVTELEVKVGHRFLAPLGRRTFPDGRVRVGSLFAETGGDGVALAVAADGYAELRLAGLHPQVGRELDLGTLRLRR